jgi:hypothetical protein
MLIQLLPVTWYFCAIKIQADTVIRVRQAYVSCEFAYIKDLMEQYLKVMIDNTPSVICHTIDIISLRLDAFFCSFFKHIGTLKHKVFQCFRWAS